MSEALTRGTTCSDGCASEWKSNASNSEPPLKGLGTDDGGANVDAANVGGLPEKKESPQSGGHGQETRRCSRLGRKFMTAAGRRGPLIKAPVSLDMDVEGRVAKKSGARETSLSPLVDGPKLEPWRLDAGAVATLSRGHARSDLLRRQRGRQIRWTVAKALAAESQTLC